MYYLKCTSFLKNVLISFSFTVNKLLINIYINIFFTSDMLLIEENSLDLSLWELWKFLICFVTLSSRKTVSVWVMYLLHYSPNKFAICQNYSSSFPLSGFPGGSDSKVSVCNAGDPSSIPGSGRSPGEGNGNPLQYSCMENSMDWGDW